jgi:hypothetical protein
MIIMNHPVTFLDVLFFCRMKKKRVVSEFIVLVINFKQQCIGVKDQRCVCRGGEVFCYVFVRCGYRRSNYIDPVETLVSPY